MIGTKGGEVKVRVKEISSRDCGRRLVEGRERERDGKAASLEDL